MKALRLTQEEFDRIEAKRLKGLRERGPYGSAQSLDTTGQPVKKPSKYRNKSCSILGPDGVTPITFHSIKEARRYQQLALLVSAGRVRNLKLQVKYHMDVNDVHVCDYIADFKYEELINGVWVWVVEDTKGYNTKEFVIKRKLMLACHGISVRIT